MVFNNLNFWQLVMIAVILTHITTASITIFLHRCQTHRTLELHPFVSHFFRFWLWFNTGSITKEWVSVHRKHHAEVDTENDPHSPNIYGFFAIFFNGTSLYRKAARDPQVLAKYGSGTPDDWLERNLYGKWSNAGFPVTLLINVVLFGWPGIAIWLVQILWHPLAGGIINGIGHLFGYRNYETKDESRNFFPIGGIFGGEELHNNHHQFQGSAKFSYQWWEFDIGWLYIKILEFFGLAKNVKVSKPKSKLVS